MKTKIPEDEYKTLDQEIMDAFKKRNIGIVSYIVKFKPSRNTFVWSIEGNKR